MELLLVKLFGIMMIAMGIMGVLSPNALRAYLNYWAEGNKIYLLGVLRLIFGIIFLFAAAEAKLFWPILTMGILILVGGVIIFSLRIEGVKKIFAWWNKKSNWYLRFVATIALMIGALIIYSA